MEGIVFDGQQQGERILYTINPHPFAKNFILGRNVLIGLFVSIFVFALVGAVGILFVLFFLAVSNWWTITKYKKDVAYITDRRIIRFDQVSPFFKTKRELFWSEALKAKAYAPNVLFQMLRIGTLEVNPLMGDSENVKITDVYYFEDLANYIVKILYTVKNSPTEISGLKPFIPKPKGKRE